MTLSIRRFVAIAAVAVLLSAPEARAEIIQYTATLSPTAMVPPTDSSGKGSAEMTFDSETRQFSWTIVYEGLSGPPTAAHFHGPADVSQNGPPVIPLTSLDSPITGSATLTDEQIQDLQAGLWYINIHTTKNPPGEIRGQVTRK